MAQPVQLAHAPVPTQGGIVPARTETRWMPGHRLCPAVQINLVSEGIGFHTLPSPLQPLKKTSFLMTYRDGAVYFVTACIL